MRNAWKKKKKKRHSVLIQIYRLNANHLDKQNFISSFFLLFQKLHLHATQCIAKLTYKFPKSPSTLTFVDLDKSFIQVGGLILKSANIKYGSQFHHSPNHLSKGKKKLTILLTVTN